MEDKNKNKKRRRTNDCIKVEEYCKNKYITNKIRNGIRR